MIILEVLDFFVWHKPDMIWLTESMKKVEKEWSEAPYLWFGNYYNNIITVGNIFEWNPSGNTVEPIDNWSVNIGCFFYWILLSFYYSNTWNYSKYMKIYVIIIFNNDFFCSFIIIVADKNKTF